MITVVTDSNFGNIPPEWLFSEDLIWLDPEDENTLTWTLDCNTYWLDENKGDEVTIKVRLGMASMLFSKENGVI